MLLLDIKRENNGSDHNETGVAKRGKGEVNRRQKAQYIPGIRQCY
jgi:hypothetical protein